jgi:hypothetical protein
MVKCPSYKLLSPLHQHQPIITKYYVFLSFCPTQASHPPGHFRAACRLQQLPNGNHSLLFCLLFMSNSLQASNFRALIYLLPLVLLGLPPAAVGHGRRAASQLHLMTRHGKWEWVGGQDSRAGIVAAVPDNQPQSSQVHIQLPWVADGR